MNIYVSCDERMFVVYFEWVAYWTNIDEHICASMPKEFHLLQIMFVLRYILLSACIYACVFMFKTWFKTNFPLLTNFSLRSIAILCHTTFSLNLNQKCTKMLTLLFRTMTTIIFILAQKYVFFLNKYIF